MEEVKYGEEDRHKSISTSKQISPAVTSLVYLSWIQIKY
jgi:hypothetical protein